MVTIILIIDDKIVVAPLETKEASTTSIPRYLYKLDSSCQSEIRTRENNWKARKIIAMTEQSAGKAHFRSVSKKKALRKREDDSEDEQDVGASESIQCARRKRKLLNSMSYKRGLDVTDTSKSSLQSSSDAVAPAKVEDASKDPDRVRAFSGGAGNRTASEGVLEQKHKAAMEDFIVKHLKTDEGTQEGTATTEQATDLEAKLFEDLQLTAQRLSGETDSKIEQTGEGDVGAGGAMLGGTGIAEVILPDESRIAAARATEEATSKMRKDYLLQHKGTMLHEPAIKMPMSFSTGPGKRARRQGSFENDTSKTMSSLNQLSKPQDLPSSYTHNFILHSQERRNKLQVGTGIEGKKSVEDGEGDRMGFAASRQVAKGEGPAKAGQKGFNTGAINNKKSTDTRVFRDFVKNIKEKGL